MPMFYQFKKNVPLERIRKDVRKWVEERGKQDDGITYDFIVISGMAILSKYDEINEQNIERYCDEIHEGNFKILLKKFLIEEYTFESWWQGK